MGSGTGSTLVIKPEGLSDLTIDLTGGGPAAGSTPYIGNLGTLDFNEERRWQIVYGQAPPGEGGEVVDEFGPLVPLTFRIIIRSTTRAGMIDAYNDLQAALLNRKGGTVKYKPEDVGGSVLDTYYHYVTSPPPRVLDRPRNRWDGPAKDGWYTLMVDVEFLTQPIATSNPNSPVTLSQLTSTIDNWVDDSPSQANYAAITANNLKGSMPALLRILARPGSSQYLGRLIMYRRSEGTLSNFASIYEAEDASEIYPSVAWSSVADSNRGDGNYMKCLPAEDANGYAQGLRFTLSNPNDHKGRFAVFGVGYDDSPSVGVWTHQVKVKGGNVVQAGRDDHESTSLHSWNLIYAGEFELPITPLSDSETGYDTGPYIEWYSTRASGSSEFRLDAILLVYVADSEMQPSALDVMCEDELGVTNDEKLLVENFVNEYGRIQELAHVVAQSDGDFMRALATAPRGDFITLDPTKDHRIIFLQEGVSDVNILSDLFTTYKADRWLLIGDFETDEDWNPFPGHAGPDTTNYVEGAQGIYTETGYNLLRGDENTIYDFTAEGRFGSGDFVCWAMYVADSAGLNNVNMRFFAPDGSNYFNYNITSFSTGWNFYAVKKSSFSQTGSPDWAEVQELYLNPVAAGGGTTVTFDFWRIEKANPDLAAIPNATGTVWNFQPSSAIWTVTEDVSGAGAVLACLDTESGVEKSALVESLSLEQMVDIRYRARVMAKKQNGYVGLIFRSWTDTLTEGAEDCYAAVLDTANNKLLVREYNGGSITQHDNPDFTCAIDTWYVIGVIVKGTTYRIYASAASALDDDDDIFDETYLLSTLTDSTFGGYTYARYGVMSISTLGRFDAVSIMSIQDKVIPADQITLSGKAIFRTIAPFCE